MTAAHAFAEPDNTPPWWGPYRRAWMAGMTDRQIAERCGVHHGTVALWRRRAGLPPHRRRAPQAPTQARALAAANTARTGRAAARDTAHAQAVLDSGVHLSARDRSILTARAVDPWASLAELAASTGLSKDGYAAALRRVLRLHPVTGP